MASLFFQSCHNKFNSAFAFGEAEFAFNLYSIRFIKVILLFITDFVFLWSTECRSGKTDFSFCAILSGMDIPELKDEVDRLRVRKTELEYIIKYKSRSDKQIDRDKLIEMLKILIKWTLKP